MNLLPGGGFGSCFDVSFSERHYMYIPKQTTQSITFSQAVDLDIAVITVSLHSKTSTTPITAITDTLYLKNGVPQYVGNDGDIVTATTTGLSITTTTANRNKEATIKIEEFDMTASITSHTITRKNSIGWVYAGAILLPDDLENTFIVADTAYNKGASKLIKVDPVLIDKNLNTKLTCINSTDAYFNAYRLATETTMEAVGNRTGNEGIRIVKFY